MVIGVEIARRFHEAYERLAPSFGYETRPDTKAFDENSPNGKLMAAVCQEIGDGIEKQSFDAGFRAGLREGDPINSILEPRTLTAPEVEELKALAIHPHPPKRVTPEEKNPF